MSLGLWRAQGSMRQTCQSHGVAGPTAARRSTPWRHAGDCSGNPLSPQSLTSGTEPGGRRQPFARRHARERRDCSMCLADGQQSAPKLIARERAERRVVPVIRCGDGVDPHASRCRRPRPAKPSHPRGAATGPAWPIPHLLGAATGLRPIRPPSPHNRGRPARCRNTCRARTCRTW